MTGDPTSTQNAFQKTWFVLSPLILFFIVQDVAQFVIIYLYELSLRYFGDSYFRFMEANASDVRYVIIGLALLTGLVSVYSAARTEIGKGSGPSDENLKAKLIRYIVLAAFAITISLGLNIALSLTGITNQSKEYLEVSANQYGASFAVGIILYGIITPIVEETVFRGVLYNRIKSLYSVKISIILSSLIFGLYHRNLVQFIYGTIMGLLIVLCYERFKSFVVPVFFHAVANIAVYSMTYFTNASMEVVTPMNCVIYLAISAVIGVFLFKERTTMETIAGKKE